MAQSATASAALPPAATPPAKSKVAQTILVVGDSLSAEYGLRRGTGWVALLEKRLAKEFAGTTVINASISVIRPRAGARALEHC